MVKKEALRCYTILISLSLQSLVLRLVVSKLFQSFPVLFFWLLISKHVFVFLQMISGLTFKQENLIRDEPVANLLRNMNEMLENLSTRRHSPLQQLVLIIGDGKFHEREKLKRSVRKFLQQKRMVVYILLDDNAEQSVLDLVVVVCTHLFSTVAWL